MNMEDSTDDYDLQYMPVDISSGTLLDLDEESDLDDTLEELVNQTLMNDINSDKIVILGGRSCNAYANKATWLLKDNGIAHKYYDIRERGYLSDLYKLTGTSRMDQVFMNGKYFGGYEDLLKYVEDLNRPRGGSRRVRKI